MLWALLMKLAVDSHLAVGEICTVSYCVGNKHSSSESGIFSSTTTVERFHVIGCCLLNALY